MHPGIQQALLAAVLFGASTPVAKALVGTTSPLILAGLLYLGSGLGLTGLRWWRRRRSGSGSEAQLLRIDLPWLAGAVLAGGMVAPALLVWGLQSVPGASAALLLNGEGVLTALIAWVVFRENVDVRVAVGMGLIVIAGGLLAWDAASGFALPVGAIAVAGACLGWAIDNNLTRKLAANDAVQLAAIKGLVAGGSNLALGVLTGAALPSPAYALGAAAVGLVAYGLSLVLFIWALRDLGTARAGAYFSVAPFAGAAVAILGFGERPGLGFWPAAGLMLVGLWLHLSERHAHAHTHEPLQHTHRHAHDEHHRHAHAEAWDGRAPHTHLHSHAPLTHTHAHYPDVHHRHRHHRHRQGRQDSA